MNAKTTGILAAAVFVLTLIWLAQVIGVSLEYGSIESFDDALAFAKEQHWFYFNATYLNAVLLTLANAVLYGSLYGLLKQEHPLWAAAALVFVPLYTILALVAYLSQLVLVPGLLEQLNEPALQPAAFALLHHGLQAYPHSAIQAFDQFSYFLLGIPGLIYGSLMWKSALLRIPGGLFVVSGVFCLPIGAGIMLGIPALVGTPSLIGGLVSIIATGWLAVVLLRGPMRQAKI